MKRQDDYESRRSAVANLSDEELKNRFWALAEQLTQPMLDMGREYTTPAIERSVLLRMGFSSIEAKAIVEGCIERNLMSHGAGHVVYKLAKHKNADLRETGVELSKGNLWDEAVALFGKEEE